MKFRILLFIFIMLFSIGGAYGFDDSVQRYAVGFEEVWEKYLYTDAHGTATISVVNYPTEYPSSKSIYISVFGDGYSSGGYSGQGYAHITSYYPIDPSYFAFTMRTGSASGFGTLTCDFTVKYLASDRSTVIGTYKIFDGISTSYSITTPTMFEFVKTDTTMIIYANGEVWQSSTLSYEDDVYVKIEANARGYSVGSRDASVNVRLDDFSTSSIIGMDEEWTQAPIYVDTSYAIQSYLSFPLSTYTMTSSRVGSGTTTNTTIITSQADFVRWNRTEIYGNDWGLYHVQLFRDSTKLAETTFTYFDSTISGSVSFDAESYSQGQTANIAYSISNPDFATYTYYIKTMDVFGTVQDTYTLTSASGTKSPSLTDYDSGIYYAILSRTSKTTGINEEFAYDYASVTETAYINGNVTEALSGTNMQNVSIQYLQGSTYYNTTSAADGTYNVSDLSISVSTAITANATYINDTNFGNNSYNLSTFSFTPLSAGIYNVDLILFDVNHTYDNVSAYGLIYDSIYHQPIESATVNIYNDTWSNSTTSTATGYYVFNNLIANGTYNINATSTGYTDTIDYEINTTTSNATRQDVPMSTLYTVTVKATDATTTAYLSTFTATLDGVEGTAVNGTVTFNNIEYGLHSISAIADDYYPSATTPLIDEDTEVILDLTRLASQYYSPHNVKFKVMSLGAWAYGGFGTLYSGVDTTVYLGSTATGDEHTSGITGTDGGVVFELSEDVQYTLTFIDATQGIDATRTLYPVKSEYEIIVFADTLIPSTPLTNNILFGCYGQSINLTHGYINVSFNDTSITTTLAELWINDTNLTNLYYFNTTNDSESWSQIVAGGNASYAVTFKLINTELSEPLTITRYISFDDTVRVNLGLDEGWKYQLIAVIIISVIALLGSALNAEKMAVVTVLVGWLMVFFGWLQAGATIPEQITLGLMMLFATLIAFGSVIRAGDAR